MTEVDQILYSLGYYDSDPQKQSIVQGYIDEATEFMRESGVPDDKLTSRRAYSVKAIWADYRDRSEERRVGKECRL